MSLFENDIKDCMAVLKNGGLILYPTDTIWGIGCDATNERAVAKIYQLKQRDEKKSMIILSADVNKIFRYAKAPSLLIKQTLQSFTKPVTIIYPEAKNLALNVINEDGTVAIRVVKDEFCKLLIAALGKPIVSTSANISGEESPLNFHTISEEIKKGVDHIVQYGRDNSSSQPSRILKWTDNDEIIIIRE